MTDDSKPVDFNAILMAQGPDALRAAFDGAHAQNSGPDGDPANILGRAALSPSAYAWTDPATIAPRAWLLGRSLCRGVVSMTVAPGGTGKSTLALCDAVALAGGRDLLAYGGVEACRCWYWNLEDSEVELKRRVQAICLHHHVRRDEIEGRLFIDSGTNQPLTLGGQVHQGFALDHVRLGQLEAAIARNRIDVLIIDPFVSSHQLNENDNGQMDALLKALARIAARTDCAISLVHHTRKPSETERLSTNSARGAKALSDAARVVRVLGVMSEGEALAMLVETPSAHVRARLDKQNFSAQGGRQTWLKLVSVTLPNGDEVGVVERWYPPMQDLDLSDEQIERIQDACRDTPRGENVQAGDWIGRDIAEILGLNIHSAADKARVKAILARLLSEGWLKSSRVAVSGKGRDRPVIVPRKPVDG